MAKNELCIQYHFVKSLTPEADNKSITLVDQLYDHTSPEKENPSVGGKRRVREGLERRSTLRYIE